MGITTVGLIGFDRAPDLAQRLREHLPQAGVGEGRVVFDAFDWSHAAKEGRAADVADRLDRCDLCLLRVGAADLGVALYQILDRLYESRIPALILTDEERLVRAHVSETEAIVSREDESLDRLALRLETLRQRQTTVSRLRGELQMARRCQDGLEGEVTRIHDEMQLAAMIQREFLPRELPEIGDARFGVFFRPTGYVSGDIYDLRRLDEHHVAFFLADAVGHGVPAALLTMVIMRCITPKVIVGSEYRIVPPGEVLANLNQEMVRLLNHGGRFATAVFGVLDTRTGRVTLAGAGHPPPLHLKSNGDARPIETDGCLLGVFADAAFGEATITLEPGDHLVVFSDGFETAFPGDRPDHLARRMPTDRYLSSFRRICTPNAPVDDCMQALSDLLDRQSGSLHQVDDITAIVLTLGEPATTPDTVEETVPVSRDATRPAPHEAARIA